MKAIFYTIIVLFAFAACTPKQQDEITVEENLTQNIKSEATPVQVSQAQKKVFENQIQAQGKLEVRQEVAIQFRLPNIISRVAVQNGSYVKKGQLIAQQETDLLKTALARAQQDVLVKKQAYLVLCCDFGYCLADTAKLTAQQRTQWMAQSGLTLAMIQEKEARIQLRQSRITAPFSGKIANLTQKQGDMAQVGQPFCKLYNPSSLEVAVEIIESDYGLIKQGLIAEIKVLSHPNKVYKGTFVRANPEVNTKGMVQVYFKLENAADLLPGMNASVTIKIPSKQNIIVPKEAVVVRSGKSVVFTEKEGFAHWNYVTLGQENAKEIEVLEGLENGSKVIITNNLQLAHDAPVKIVQN